MLFPSTIPTFFLFSWWRSLHFLAAVSACSRYPSTYSQPILTLFPLFLFPVLSTPPPLPPPPIPKLFWSFLLSVPQTALPSIPKSYLLLCEDIVILQLQSKHVHDTVLHIHNPSLLYSPLPVLYLLNPLPHCFLHHKFSLKRSYLFFGEEVFIFQLQSKHVHDTLLHVNYPFWICPVGENFHNLYQKKKRETKSLC